MTSTSPSLQRTGDVCVSHHTALPLRAEVWQDVKQSLLPIFSFFVCVRVFLSVIVCDILISVKTRGFFN